MMMPDSSVKIFKFETRAFGYFPKQYFSSKVTRPTINVVSVLLVACGVACGAA